MALKSRRGTSGTMGGFTEANGPTTGQSDQSDARATIFACPGYSIWAEDTHWQDEWDRNLYLEGRQEVLPCWICGFIHQNWEWFRQIVVLAARVGAYQVRWQLPA